MVRLLSWNVNGVRAVSRKGMLARVLEEKPDILCLQETKACQDQLGPEIRELPGYRADWHSAERKGYSGVATYTRVVPDSVLAGLGRPVYDREGRVLVSRYPGFVLYNVYFPNGKASPERLAYKLRFYDDFLLHLRRRRAAGERRVVVCGDVNTAHQEIDLARPRENRDVSGFLPEERAWIDRFLAAGHLDAFREFERGPGHYTWWDMQTRARDRNVGWRIDYVFVSAELRPRLKSAFHLPAVLGSDHCPVGIELE